MITFSEFLKILYPICGNGMKPADFIVALIDSVTDDMDDEFNPLLDNRSDYLASMYRGSRKIPKQDATFILGRLSKNRFADYISCFSDDGIKSISLKLSDMGYAVKDKYHVASACAELLAGILNERITGTNQYVPVSKAESKDQDNIDDACCLERVFAWLEPSSCSTYRENAAIKYRADESLEINVNTGSLQDNDASYAGVYIQTKQKKIDISGYKYLNIDYSGSVLRASGNAQEFEIKLESPGKTCSLKIPLSDRRVYEIPLAEFKDEGVDLRGVQRVVIAVNAKRIGANNQCGIVIYNTCLT